MRSPTTVMPSTSTQRTGVQRTLRRSGIFWAGLRPAKACFSRRMLSGVVPQQPPAIEMPVER